MGQIWKSLVRQATKVSGLDIFPQSIHQWNVHPLLTHMSLL